MIELLRFRMLTDRWLVLLLVSAVCILPCVSCRADDSVKVLFIGKQPDHPFATHMYLHTGEMLSRCLKLSGDVETVVSDEWPKDPAALEDVNTIVLYMTPAAEFLLDGPHREQFEALMRQGVGLVTLHWASSVHQKNFDRLGATWMSYLGGTWVSNVGLHTGKSPLRQLAPQHPISRGWDEYELHDEYYLNPTISDKATPLVQVMARDQPVVVGWAYERPGGGRAFGTTLGHFYRNFQRDRFRRMIVNAILWTAKVEVPDDGANVDLPAEHLALPKPPRS